MNASKNATKLDGSSEEELETLDIAGEYEHDESKRAEDESNGKDVKNKGKKKGMKRTKSSYDGSKRGVCYLSRIPPGMDPASLRHMLSQYGEIERIYLAPTDPAAAQVSRKRPGSCKGNAFSEGWVEFVKKGVAKRIANMLNGEQMGMCFFSLFGNLLVFSISLHMKLSIWLTSFPKAG
ncbi:hypothetical protein Taro_011338 [Colocasia esculenta]|uniref:RRM domain-containing protein n=1 Tax=Colocasia esculenta TaxID=4460 RepID=A0A843UAL8_COLES|nr:hypothetical protein [Colocasia esculenta]